MFEMDDLLWLQFNRQKIESLVKKLREETTIMFSEKTGYGVLNGLEVSAQIIPDLTVKISSGVFYLPSGIRVNVESVNSLSVIPDISTGFKGIVYVDKEGVVSYLSGVGTEAIAGSRTYTISTNAVATDTFTIQGVEFVAVASEPTGSQFIVGEDAATTATNLTAALSANEIISADFDCTVEGSVITLTEKIAGNGDTPEESTKTGTIEIENGIAITSVPAASSSTYPDAPENAITIAYIVADAGATFIDSNCITGNITPFGLNVPGDIEISNKNNGIILTSPAGTRYRISVQDEGDLLSTSLE
jgi:hypothetical protein